MNDYDFTLQDQYRTIWKQEFAFQRDHVYLCESGKVLYNLQP